MGIINKSAIFLIQIYKIFISPLFPSCCRFYPTCSDYMILAIRRYGALKGVYLGIRRLGRCHPFSLGGYDPVK